MRSEIKPIILLQGIFTLLVLGCMLAISQQTWAADNSLCARVKIEIRQELILERQAFDAHMAINNALSHITLENVNVDVTFAGADGSTILASSDPDNTNALFFIRVDSMDNISDVAGAGMVAPSTTADIHWLIIPAPGAANKVPQGTLYYVGATLSYTIGGEEHVTEVTPDYIFVKPMPELTLDYFIPHDVYGDDAFTTEIEPPVPFSLGVRVSNSGFGTARKVKIDSAQPKIVDNQLGLLIGFALTGASVNGSKTTSSLLADFGDISPNACGVGRWNMTCSLSGQFTEFTATFTHSDELGGELTSLIDAINTHFLVHDVVVDLPGRDGIGDFLAEETPGSGIYRVYESDHLTTEVVDRSNASSLSGSEKTRTLSTLVTSGCMYAKVPDPFSGQMIIKEVVRSDGKRIPSDNVWFSKSRDQNKDWLYFINLFDTQTTNSYTLIFEESTDSHAPVLQLIPDRYGLKGEQVSFIVEASDPDGTIPALSATPLPVGSDFTDGGNGVATFDWTPQEGQSGRYEIVYTASDGTLTDTQTSYITICDSVTDPACAGMNGEYYVVPSPFGDDTANTGTTPDSPFATIGHAIETAQGSETNPFTIHVAAGTYAENIEMDDWESLEGGWNSDFSKRWDFVLSGPSPTAEYKTVIDGGGETVSESCLTLNNLSSEQLLIDGFTLQNGVAPAGGGIDSRGSAPRIINCEIINNATIAGGSGGGLALTDSVAGARVENCKISGNRADYGGGIYLDTATVEIVNSLITHNQAQNRGGGIDAEDSSPVVTNTTIADNHASMDGGGLLSSGDSAPVLINSILWGNTGNAGPSQLTTLSGTPLISHCDIQGSGGSGVDWDEMLGTDEDGNLDVDPLFVDPNGADDIAGNADDDFRLTLQSPCIDRGDNAAVSTIYKDYEGDPRILPIGGTVDLGADEVSVASGLAVQYNDGAPFPEGLIDHGWSEKCAATGNNMYRGECLAESASPVNWASGNTFAATWEGFLYVPRSGEYTFSSNGDVDGVVHIEVDGTVVADLDTSVAPYTHMLILAQGTWVPVSMSFAPNGERNRMVLGWIPPGGTWEPVPGKYLRSSLSQVNVAVQLQGDPRPDEGYPVPLTVEFFAQGADVTIDSPVYSYTGTTENYADTTVCTILGAPSGSFDITVKSDRSLVKLINEVEISDSRTFVDVGTLELAPSNNPPQIPSSPTPSSGAIGVSTLTALSWVGGDPDTGDTVSYDVYLDTVDPPDNQVSANQANPVYSAGSLEFDATYYWRVVATDTASGQTLGPVWSFTSFSREGDADNDGVSNEEEILGNSDPFDPNSTPETISVILDKGFNLVSIPADMSLYADIDELLEDLGGISVVSFVRILDPEKQTYQEIGYDETGEIYGKAVPLSLVQESHGLMVYAKQHTDINFFSKQCSSWNLYPGTNLVGTPCVPSGLTAFQLLQAIGDETVISSIQRFNPKTGRFETAGYLNGQTAGVNFPIESGAGYFIFMKQVVPDFGM